MRELKFRVWDKLAKTFIYPDKGYQGHYILTLNGKFHNLHNGSGADEHEVSQFTGLKDKNGKEIYDGDIIRGRFDMGPAGFITRESEVGYNPHHGYDWNYWDLASVEVIGNVFENEKLMDVP